MHTPNHDTMLGSSGLAHRTIVDEWPKVKADIDNGHPSPLDLIEVYSFDPTLLGENHQVLAYGYELNTTTKDLGLPPK